MASEGIPKYAYRRKQRTEYARIMFNTLTSIHTIEATPIETTLPGAALTLANLSIAECQGNYSATFGALKLATGFFSFGVKQSDIALGVLFDGSLVAAKSNRSLVFPSDLCSVSLYLDHLRFHGTLATILNGLRNTIEQVMHNAIEAHICTQLSGTVAPFANALFSPLVLPPLSSPLRPSSCPTLPTDSYHCTKMSRCCKVSSNKKQTP